MALGTPAAAGTPGTGTTSAVTGSFTPAANSRLLFAVAARKNAGVPAQPTISDSVGLTWTEIGDAQHNYGADPDVRMRSFYSSAVGGSPASMTVTGACSDGATTIVIGLAITGSGTDFSNFANAANQAAGDPTVTIPSSPVALMAGFMCGAGAAAITPPTGFTEVAELASGNLRADSVYDDTSPTTGPHVWASTNGNSSAVLFEIKEPAAGGSGKPTHFMHYQRLRASHVA